MLTLSASLAESLKGRDKDLRFTVEIAGFNNSLGKAIVFSSAPLVASGVDVVPLLQPIRDNAARVDLDGFRTTYAGVGFSVVDEGDLITSRLDDFDFIGKSITLKLGTTREAFTDYVTLYQGIITSMDIGGSPRAYGFRTADVQENLNQFVFITAKSKLTVDMTAQSSTMTLEDASGFNLAGPFTNYEPVSVARGHVIIGRGDTAEVIEWRAKASNDLQTLQRAQHGTLASAHAIGDDVIELVSWPGHPLEILAVILSGASLEEPAGFSSVPASWKMGTLVTLDTANWILAKDRTRWAIWQYRTTQKIFARNFAEAEVMHPLKLFLRANVSNALSVAPFIERPIPLEAARELAKDQVGPDLDWTADGERISNRMTIEHDFDPVAGTFRETTEFNETASQARFGVRRPATLSLHGLRDESAESQAEVIAREHFILFGQAAPIVRLSAFLRQVDMEPGDPIKVTHPQLPKRESGTRGEAAHFLKILERSAAFFGPSVGLTLYDADIPSVNKYASIAPDSTPDFDSATALQQTNYVFIDQSYRPA